MSHAKLSPSGSAQWIMCPVSPRRQEGLPDSSGAAADWGTIAHDLAERCLKDGTYLPLQERLSTIGVVDGKGDVTYHPRGMARFVTGGQKVEEMEDTVKVYCDFVRDLEKAGGDLRVECRLPIDHITGEEGAHGTTDSVLIFSDELAIVDLKGGMAKVEAKYSVDSAFTEDVPEDLLFFAEVVPNTQLLIYADAALRSLAETDPARRETIKRVRYIIVQPRLGHIDEHVMPVEDHLAWVEWVKTRAEKTRSPSAVANPGHKQCMYCKASGICPEQKTAVLNEVFSDFDSVDLLVENIDTLQVETRVVDYDELANVFKLTPFITGFLAAVYERCFEALMDGKAVGDLKLVAGREGNRKWQDADLAQDTLVKLIGDKAFKKSLISPSDAEKMINPRSDNWQTVSGLITRSPGGPIVAKGSDSRPVFVRGGADDFDDETDFVANFFKE